MQSSIEQRLENLEQGFNLAGIVQKDILTTKEVALYTGLSLSHIYKLTAQHAIPHFKPTGKVVYFEREELIRWMKQNRVASSEELEQRALNYCMKGGRV